MFSFHLPIELAKNIEINKYTIKLQNGKQLPYRLIYSLELVKLETLKAYIKTYPKNRFIQFFKSLTDAFILFCKEPNIIITCISTTKV